MRIAPPLCAGDILSVSASAGPSNFRTSFVLPRSVASGAQQFGVSVPVDAAPGLYEVSTTCSSQDVALPPVFGTVTVTNASVAPVVTAIIGTQSSTPTWRVTLVGTGCRSGGLSADRATIYIGT